MFSFEGEYRRKPVQSLGGASKHSQRDVFIQRTQLERQKREVKRTDVQPMSNDYWLTASSFIVQELRKQNHSAVIIQAFFRGCQTRILQKNLQRQEFELIQNSSLQNVDVETLVSLMTRLKFFFNKDQDSAKLVWMSQLVIKNSSSIMKHCETKRAFAFSLAQFFSLILHYICDTLSSSESKGSHWRVLEIFLNSRSWQKILSVQTADEILGHIFGMLAHKGK